MIILGIDFETTGLDPKEDRVVEVGVCLWDTGLRRPVSMADYLVDPGRAFSSERWDDAEKVHKIPREACERHGVSQETGLTVIGNFADKAEFMVAHNGALFDQLFFDEWVRRVPLAPVPVRPWIDTRLDLPEPMTGPLITQAAKRGFLNPFPHQALSDVLTMLRILDGYDMDEVARRSRTPTITVQFIGPFASKDQAKNNGFYWRPEEKRWLKAIKEPDFGRELEAAKPWSIRRVS